MNKFMWILGATCLGVAAYVLLTDVNGAGTRAADGVDEFGERVGGWGTRNRAAGAGGVLGGKLKQGFGKLTGDDELAGEGYADEAGGRLKDTAGQAAHAVSETISDLNR